MAVRPTILFCWRNASTFPGIPRPGRCDTDSMHTDPDDPVTVDRLADLQAGRLDDRTAARLRQRARTEPDIANQLAALDRIRRDVAALGRDPASAPPVPADVTARIGATLRAAPSIEAPPPSRRWRRVAAVARPGSDRRRGGGQYGDVARGEVRRARGGRPAGGGRRRPAAVRGPARRPAATAPRPRRPGRSPAARSLSRRAGLPGVDVPARCAAMGRGGRPAVLMLLPGDAPRQITAIVVTPGCNSANTGLITSTVVDRP